MSGARNCPETPRQKMIGMMYLVLTAMLALNVSSEILNGFTMVDDSLHTTIESAELRNSILYEDFESLNKENPLKVGEWLAKAKKIQKESDEMFYYIQEYKYQIIKLADKEEADKKGRKIIGRDNLDAAGEFALVRGNGIVLKEKLEKYRKLLVENSIGNPSKQKMYETVFSTSPINDKPWIESIFQMMPVSAVVTILSKYQSDIRSSEAELVQYLKNQTDASDFRVNKIEALVVPNSRYIIKGDRYSAQIVLSAVDSTKTPQVFLGGRELIGGKYEFTCGKAGTFNYDGEIRMKVSDGSFKTYRFKSDYIVGEPSATISNEDLNVVYRGIDNRFSVSVPGVAAQNVSVRANGASVVNKGAGKYIINPTQDGEINISVFGKINGKDMAMGSNMYRVKRLPKPTAFLMDGSGTQTMGGLMSLDELRGTTIIASYGKDEIVKANFRVVSFTMIVDGLAPSNVNGSRLDQNFLNKLTKGRNLIISNIIAVGPDGYNQNLGVILIRLA